MKFYPKIPNMKRKQQEEDTFESDTKSQSSIEQILKAYEETKTDDFSLYEKHKHQIRVGRTTYNGGKPQYPSFNGFRPIICLTKSSAYGDLGPYVLTDESGRIMENLWQFSKVYNEVPATCQTFSRWKHNVVWEHPQERHVNKDGTLKPEYWDWRLKGMQNSEPVRYPVGKGHAKECLYAIINEGGEKLGYIDSRKQIYAPIYIHLVKQQKKFATLKKRLEKGENLLIIEVDGPHEESLDYYKKNFNVDDDFITGSTILATKENLGIMLNDTKHPFGHGYCLAMALLGLSCSSLPVPTKNAHIV